MRETYKTGLPSVDKPWLKNFDKEELEMELPECSVYSYIFENNKKYPNDIGISYLVVILRIIVFSIMWSAQQRRSGNLV